MFWKKFFGRWRKQNSSSLLAEYGDTFVLPKVYAVVIQSFDIDVLTYNNESVELFENADDAIDFMNNHKPALLLIKEIKRHKDYVREVLSMKLAIQGTTASCKPTKRK